MRYVASFSTRELSSLLRRGVILSELLPRIPMDPRRTPTWVLFADDAAKTKLFAAILFRGGYGDADRASKCTSGAAPLPVLLDFALEIKSTGLIYSPR